MPGPFNLLKPPDGSTNLPLADSFCWEASEGAAFYDLYMSTSGPDNLIQPGNLVQSGIVGPFYGCFGLQQNSTYWWAVVACNPAGSTENNLKSDHVFSFTTLAVPGWAQSVPLPKGPKNKNVKDGGCLAALGPDGPDGPVLSDIYALKGNNTCELYAYNPNTRTWFLSDTIPSMDPSGKKRGARKGATLTAAGGQLYFSKGKSTDGFWNYNPSVHARMVTVVLIKPPPGEYGIENLWHTTSAVVGNTACVYFLEQAGTCGFLRYNPQADSWQVMASAPLGVSGRTFKDGSCLTSDGQNTIYVLKGSYNEFYCYDVARNVWTTKASLPFSGSSGRKKKAGDGAALAYLNGYVYAQKGNNTLEMWRYDPVANAWTQIEDVPVGGGKKVKGGGAMTAAGGALYAFKGNNTLEFYSFTPATADGLPRIAGRPDNAQSGTELTTRGSKLNASPNPFSTATTVRYSVPRAGCVSLKLYDLTGKLVTTLANGYRSAGPSSFILNPASISRGLYLLRLETGSSTITAKLVVE